MKPAATAAGVILLVLCAATRAAAPPAELQKRVRAATFEVVVPKSADEGVTYERPLPLELLPFTERNDRFWPVGTAFAIAPRTFVSAGHVLSGSLSGAGGPPALRASTGELLQIDAVLRYSMHQDFIVFTTAGAASPVPLETTTTIELDEPVFAVGNAHGEGVVIRDGLLTSLTPEDQDGRWKWLRYSAATSPGNSGGPLLNAAGKVLGVVIGKSESENHNYALPIEHVLSAPEQARIDLRFLIRLPILRDASVARYDDKFALPLPVAEFDRRMEAAVLRMYREQRSLFLTKNDAELFPRGKSEKLLASVPLTTCPMLIVQGEDRTWELDESPREAPTCLTMATSVCGLLRVLPLSRSTAE